MASTNLHKLSLLCFFNALVIAHFFAKSHCLVRKQESQNYEDTLSSTLVDYENLREPQAFMKWHQSHLKRFPPLRQNEQKLASQHGFKCKKSSFKVVWNAPTHGCLKYEIDIDAILKQYGIIYNPKPSMGWWGPEIILISEVTIGLLPRILRNGTFLYGGIPQLGNLTAHLNKATVDLNRLVPDTNFRGLGVFDWESWRPVWERNFDPYKVYQTASIEHVKSLHPTWPKDEIVAEAKKEFEQGARAFMEGTVNLLKRLRPDGKYGFYGFPRCTSPPGVKHCNHHQQRQHNEILWLFNASTATFPSLYMRTNDSSHNRDFVHNQVGEVLRIQRKVSPHNLQGYLYCKFRYVVGGNYVSKKDLATQLNEACHRGMDGVVFWDDYYLSASEQRCTQLVHNLHDVIGPVINNLRSKSYIDL